jgi:hypothetical protein
MLQRPSWATAVGQAQGIPTNTSPLCSFKDPYEEFKITNSSWALCLVKNYGRQTKTVPFSRHFQTSIAVS